MRKEEFISNNIFCEIAEVGFTSKFIKGTYTEIDGILYDLHIPTFSEIFAWFRYKFKIYVSIKDEQTRDIVYFQYHFRYYQEKYMSSAYNCYEEAEIAALDYVMIHFRKMIIERKKEIQIEFEVDSDLIEFEMDSDLIDF